MESTSHQRQSDNIKIKLRIRVPQKYIFLSFSLDQTIFQVYLTFVWLLLILPGTDNNECEKLELETSSGKYYFYIRLDSDKYSLCCNRMGRLDNHGTLFI